MSLVKREKYRWCGHNKCPNCGFVDYIEVLVEDVPRGSYYRRCAICGEVTGAGMMGPVFDQRMHKEARAEELNCKVEDLWSEH